MRHLMGTRLFSLPRTHEVINHAIIFSPAKKLMIIVMIIVSEYVRDFFFLCFVYKNLVNHTQTPIATRKPAKSHARTKIRNIIRRAFKMIIIMNRSLFDAIKCSQWNDVFLLHTRLECTIVNSHRNECKQQRTIRPHSIRLWRCSWREAANLHVLRVLWLPIVCSAPAVAIK